MTFEWNETVWGKKCMNASKCLGGMETSGAGAQVTSSLVILCCEHRYSSNQLHHLCQGPQSSSVLLVTSVKVIRWPQIAWGWCAGTGGRVGGAGGLHVCVCAPLVIRKLWGLPWWRSGWESACQCRGHGFEPWSGTIPRAVEQVGPWATTTEPARLELVLCNGRGRDSERPAHRDEEWPLLAATRESPRTEMKTQHSQK